MPNRMRETRLDLVWIASVVLNAACFVLFVSIFTSYLSVPSLASGFLIPMGGVTLVVQYSLLSC